jgi:hypothetical protein
MLEDAPLDLTNRGGIVIDPFLGSGSRQFCPHATFGSISTCLKPHVDEASASCKSALAFMASPGHYLAD